MKLAHKGTRYDYYVSDEGLIYRKSKHTDFKEVVKRFGTRGVVELKIDGKSKVYKHFVAVALIPNPDNADKVFSKDGDQMNTHPSNLYWKWTRERRNFTAQQALERTKDKYLIEYYTTGDKRVLKRGINNVFEKIYGKIDSEFIGELYITIQNYADRNLLFDLEKDIIGTYIGLKKQQFRKQVKTVSLSKFGDKTNIIADYE